VLPRHRRDGMARFTGALIRSRVSRRADAISEATFVVEREIGSQADLLIEYLAIIANHSGPRQVINSGAYRFAATQNWGDGSGQRSRSGAAT